MKQTPPLSARLREMGPISAVTFSTLILTLTAHVAAGVTDLPGVAVALSMLYVTIMVGYLIAKLVPTKLPDLFWVSIVASLAGMPFTPGSDLYVAQLSKLNLVATITPVLAVAGLGLSRSDVRLFRSTGVQMIVISLLVFGGTFLGSAVVAEFVIRLIDA